VQIGEAFVIFFFVNAARHLVFLLRVLPMQLYVRLLFGTHMIHMNTYIHMSVFVDRYIQQLC
jgi:hypothetical protein